jgi:2-desacetyl-2-hydroxyethyl bacteriochlorophyllide A dehydrogenase
MRAAVLHRPLDLRIEERPLPEARPGWVVVAVEATGICGTDVAVFQGRHPARLPLVLGHEYVGRVLAAGDGVLHVVAGQRVVAQGGWACGECEPCRAGRPASCAARVLLGRTIDGCFADAIAVRAVSVAPLPDHLDPVEAQSAVTVATAVRAVRRAGTIVGRRVAVLGLGHAGLLLLQVCVADGAREVVGFGTRASRLALARTHGAADAVNVRAADFEARLGAAGPDGIGGFDVVFEASGTTAGLAHAMRLAQTGGTVVAYGIITSDLNGVPGYELYARELTITASRGAGDLYAAAAQLIARGAVRVAPLVSHRLPLDQIHQGFALMTERSEHALRIVLLPRDGAATSTTASR